MAPITLDDIRMVVEQATWSSSRAYLLLALAIAGPAFGAFIGAYFKKKGETAALKSDLAEIKSQLAETTKVAEEVKTSIGFADWHARESLALRRAKLQEISEKLSASHREIKTFWPKAAAGVIDERQTPYAALDSLEALVPLYFPRLIESFGPYSIQASNVIAIGYRMISGKSVATTREELDRLNMEAARCLEFEFPILATAAHDLKNAIRCEMSGLVTESPA